MTTGEIIIGASFLLQALAVVWRGGQISAKVDLFDARLSRIERFIDSNLKLSGTR